jgi:hypothetical protein
MNERIKDTKNPLLRLSQKQLLKYADQPGSYDQDEMLEALHESGGLEHLTPEESERRQNFIDMLNLGIEMGWLIGFFADFGKDPFKIVDIATWAANNLEYDKNEEGIAREMMERFTEIVEEYCEADKHLIEKFPDGRYQVVDSADNPLLPENDEDDEGGGESDEDEEDDEEDQSGGAPPTLH